MIYTVNYWDIMIRFKAITLNNIPSKYNSIIIANLQRLKSKRGAIRNEYVVHICKVNMESPRTDA